MILHTTKYKTGDNLSDFANKVYFKAQQVASHGDVEVVFKTSSKIAAKIINPKVFYFKESNFENLMQIRTEVGKELTKRIQQKPFNDFKLNFTAYSSPSCEQRSYYWGVVIPTIQEYFKSEGNYIKENDLHEAIKDCISSEEGLTCEKINPITGEVYQGKITISNAGNKAEVVKYIDAVIRWAAGYGIHIPEPINNKE